MPTKRRTAKRIGSLVDLPDGQFWELLLGPRSCDGNRCDRPGHYIPQRLGTPASDDPERPLGTRYYPLKEKARISLQDGVPFPEREYRVERTALCSEWATVEERREVYWACRDEVLETNAGSRGWAFWAIEAGEHPGDEAAWLAEHDKLSASEEGRILSWSESAERMIQEHGSLAPANRYKVAADIIRARRGIPDPIPR